MKERSIEITWTDQSSRIMALFTSYNETTREVSISTPIETITTKLWKDENQEDFRRKISEALAGQPVGKTLSILESL